MTTPLFKNSQPLHSSLSELFSRGELWCGDLSHKAPTHLTSPSTTTISTGAPEIDRALPQGGLQLGATHEFFLQDPTQSNELPITIPTILARSLIEHTSTSDHSPWNAPSQGISPLLFLWIGKRCWPTPFVLPKQHLAQCLFINPPSRELLLWAIDTALRSPSVKSLVADCRDVPPSLLRRFQFAARSSGATAFLLRPSTGNIPVSCAHSQWSISPSPSPHENPTWQLTLERAKGGLHQKVSWLVSAESEYEGGEKVSIRILSELVNRRSSESAYEQEQAQEHGEELNKKRKRA